MSNEQKLSANISTPIYVECDKMYQSKLCVQEFRHIMPGLNIQPEQSENNNPARNKEDASCETLQLKYFSFH